MSELFLTYDWEPPVEDTFLALSAVGEYMTSLYDVLVEARAVAMSDMEHRFMTETDPYGRHWEELVEEYATEKEESGFSGPILTRTGELRDAATSREAWEIAGEDLFFNFSGLPEYGFAHQFGASRTRGGNLPERQFVGLSEEAMGNLEGIGGRKIANAQAIWETGARGGVAGYYVHPGGAVQERLSSGRFGKKVK